MKKSLINKAIRQVLKDGPPDGIEGLWPNVDPKGKKERPYFELAFTTAARTGPTLKEDVKREQGQFSVTIVAEEDTGENYANELADMVEELFPQGRVILTDDATITIMKPADIRPGLSDTPDWRVPVMVNYSAVNQRT